MAAMYASEQFEMDSVDERQASGSQSPKAPADAAASSVRRNSGTGPAESEPSAIANADIELSRRAVPVIEADDDVCSVCLDSFTHDDPGNQTTCGHCYHLQCIMQWAQRSRECPMCFKPLRLQDSTLTELLPFGEYVPPERFSNSGAHMLMGLDAWELERLLHRLATNGPGSTNARRERRSRNRTSLQAAPAAVSMGISDERGQRRSMGTHANEGPASTSGSAADDAAHAGSSRDAMPSSWPPISSHNRSPSPQAQDGKGGDNLRSRWAAVSNRCRESLSKTTRELKGRWGGSTHRGSNDYDSHSGSASGTGAGRSSNIAVHS